MKKYDNYVANLKVLASAEKEDLSNEFIISGVIDKFFIQFELGWKLLKELLKYEGSPQASSGSPREIIKTAYTVYDFIDENLWLSMLNSRNDMSHIYDGNAAKRMVGQILEQYIPAFEQMQKSIEKQYGQMLME